MLGAGGVLYGVALGCRWLMVSWLLQDCRGVVRVGVLRGGWGAFGGGSSRMLLKAGYGLVVVVRVAEGWYTGLQGIAVAERAVKGVWCW